MFVLGFHQVIKAQVLVAKALGVALTEAVGFVIVLDSSILNSNHSVLRAEGFIIGRVLKPLIELVACTFLGVLAAISALATRLSLPLVYVLLYLIALREVLLNILNSSLRTLGEEAYSPFFIVNQAGIGRGIVDVVGPVEILNRGLACSTNIHKSLQILVE